MATPAHYTKATPDTLADLAFCPLHPRLQTHRPMSVRNINEKSAVGEASTVI
jgi:hypothetical protein